MKIKRKCTLPGVKQADGFAYTVMVDNSMNELVLHRLQCVDGMV